VQHLDGAPGLFDGRDVYRLNFGLAYLCLVGLVFGECDLDAFDPLSLHKLQVFPCQAGVFLGSQAEADSQGE